MLERKIPSHFEIMAFIELTYMDLRLEIPFFSYWIDIERPSEEFKTRNMNKSLHSASFQKHIDYLFRHGRVE
jgi:hypothetical protein